MIPQKLIIIVAGGFGTEAAWVVQEMGRAAAPAHAPWEMIGYADDDIAKKGPVLDGVPVLGTLADAGELLRGLDVHYFCAIGKNRTRCQVAERVLSWDWRPATLIHPSAIVAPRVAVGKGTYIGVGSVLYPGAQVGSHVIVNTHVSVGHGARVGDFAQLCPGVRISGDCVIEELAFLGSNASVAPGVTVGRAATVGANSFAFCNVKPGMTAMGIPALSIGCRL